MQLFISAVVFNEGSSVIVGLHEQHIDSRSDIRSATMFSTPSPQGSRRIPSVRHT